MYIYNICISVLVNAAILVLLMQQLTSFSLLANVKKILNIS